MSVIFLGRGLKNHCVPNDYLIPVPEKSLGGRGGAGVGPQRFLELGCVLEEGVPDGEGGGCFGYGDGSGDDAGIVTAVD